MRQYLSSIIIIINLIFIGQSMSAQIGIRIKYISNGIDDTQASSIEEFTLIEDALSTGFGLGVDYWFRLKDKRIEFLPEIGINYSSSSADSDLFDIDMNYNYLYFNLNTRIYPMDFGGDCDCPTFSNQSTLIKKGFYFELSPGLGYYTSHFNTTQPFVANPEGEKITTSEDGFAYKVGLGIGLDIGISNLVTINPYAMYNYHFGRNYINAVGTLLPTVEIDQGGNDMSQLELGLRFAIRFDAKNY